MPRRKANQTPEEAKAALEKSRANLIFWKPGQSGNPHGRPKRFTNALKKELQDAGYERVYRDDLEEIYERLLNVSEEELKAVAQDTSLPAYMTIIARRLLDSRAFEALETILNRAHGEAKKRLEGDVAINHDVKDTIALSQLLKQSGFVPASPGDNPDQG